MPRRRRNAVAVAAATLADIAKLAQVSEMTVSRVVRDDARVTIATRSHVMKYVRALGYTPSRTARQLATGRAPHIGLIYDAGMAQELAPILIAAQRAADTAQLCIVPCEAGTLSMTRLRSLRGAVVLAPVSGEVQELAEREGVPIVVVGADTPRARCVNIDEFAAAHRVTEELISLGHRSIAFIDSPCGASAGARRRGFAHAIGSHVPHVAGTVMVSSAITCGAGMQALDRLLDIDPSISAIVASHDLLGVAAIQAAQRRRLAVPADLSVVGFGNRTVALRSSPELTTVSAPFAAMTVLAIEMLVGAARHRGSTHFMPFDIVHRESTAPCSAAPATACGKQFAA